MLFKGNSSRLELLIGKIHAHKEPSQDEQHKSKGLNATFFSISFSPRWLSSLSFVYVWFFIYLESFIFQNLAPSSSYLSISLHEIFYSSPSFSLSRRFWVLLDLREEFYLTNLEIFAASNLLKGQKMQLKLTNVDVDVFESIFMWWK